MKKLYQKPITEVVTIIHINSAIMVGSNGTTPSIPDHKQHCSNCRWNPDVTEAWHCDHSKNPWTGEPFYLRCDFYGN